MRTIEQKRISNQYGTLYLYFSPELESMNASNLKIPSLLKNKTKHTCTSTQVMNIKVKQNNYKC